MNPKTYSMNYIYTDEDISLCRDRSVNVSLLCINVWQLCVNKRILTYADKIKGKICIIKSLEIADDISLRQNIVKSN